MTARTGQGDRPVAASPPQLIRASKRAWNRQAAKDAKQFALGPEPRRILAGVARHGQLRSAEVDPAGAVGTSQAGFSGFSSRATTQLWARTVGARLGQRAVYSWKVQVPQ